MEQEQSPSSTERLLTEREAAEWLGVSISYVRAQRRAGVLGFVPMPPTVIDKDKPKKRPSVRYRLSALEAFVASLEQKPTVAVNSHGRRTRGGRAA